MTVRVDPLLASLISSLRELPVSERENMILSERRRILSSTESKPYIKYSNILKLVYIRLLSYRVGGIDFLNACESDVPRIKTAGYLGMMAMEDAEYVVMMINTIIKDLGRTETRNDALTAICNLGDVAVLSELARRVCPNAKDDPFHKKVLVAFYRLNPGAKVSVVGQDPDEIYVKVQVLIDLSPETGAIGLTENDVLFLTSLFMKSDNAFLRVKLLQLFRILRQRGQLRLDREFLDSIEATIIPSRDKIRPQIEIALAIEAVEFLLDADRNSSRIEAFVFRLIESQNPNSRHFGLQIARRYRIHREVAIDRCIKTGLHDRECLRALAAFVNRANHKSIYKRKDEMVFYMERANAGRRVVNEALATVFSKVVQYARDDFLVRIYQEFPEICMKIPFDRNIPKDHVLKLFNKICITVNSRYFPLIYQLLQSNARNDEFHSLVFEKHLNILVIERNRNKELDTLIRLLDNMLVFGMPGQNRDILVAKYREIAREDNVCEVLDLMLNTIYLLNARLLEKVVNVYGEHFIHYSVCSEKNEVSLTHRPAEIQIQRVFNKETEFTRIREDISDSITTATYSIGSHRELNVETLADNACHVVNLEI